MKSQETKKRFQSFDNQNWFQLACVQSATVGLAAMMIGQRMAKEYGTGTAICSMIVGNLILWLIGIAIVSMVDRMGSHAIDNIKSYIGKYGGMLAALILMIAFLNWYAFQINFSMNELEGLWEASKPQEGFMIRLGASLGLLASLLSMGGIRLLRRLSVFCLPLFICFQIYLICVSDISVAVKGTWGLSFSAVLIAVLALLPGVLNFPTIFRHSQSKVHSFLAISVLTVVVTFFEISTIWVTFQVFDQSALFFVFLIIFLIFILVFCNLINIYLASACWEVFVPKFEGGKEFAIIGLVGTLTYTFIQISTPVQFLQDLTDAYLAILGIVLLISYLIRLIVKHRPRYFEKLISFIIWIFGCFIATAYEAHFFLSGTKALVSGMNASIVLFLCVIFFEETLWAIRKKVKRPGRVK